MTGENKQLVDEATMEKMSVAPPPEDEREQDAAPAGTSGVADEDPLSAHPT